MLQHLGWGYSGNTTTGNVDGIVQQLEVNSLAFSALNVVLAETIDRMTDGPRGMGYAGWVDVL